MNDEESKARNGLLPDELEPPPGAVDRIADALAARGLIRRASRLGRARWVLTAAAAAAAFAGGLFIGAGAGHRASGAAEAPRFVLFLSPLPNEDAAGEARRVAEYKSWAAGVRNQGRFVAGEKLEDGGRVVFPSGEIAAPAPDLQGGVAGYFLFEAKSLEDAVAIARSCPHVKHGGRITVRAVAPV
ncbi:MAG: YciI family protein [Acidobacteriota bacterium]|nr:YciI family protein [Acidobacteriota bacterium]